VTQNRFIKVEQPKLVNLHEFFQMEVLPSHTKATVPVAECRRAAPSSGGCRKCAGKNRHLRCFI